MTPPPPPLPALPALPPALDQAHEEILRVHGEHVKTHGEFVKTHEEMEKIRAENANLLRRIEWFKKQMFGQKSERRAGGPVDALTQDLFGKQPEATAEEIREETSEPAAKPRRRRGGRKTLPAELPREEILHDVEPEEKICACCGKEKVRIGEDVTEKVEHKPAQIYVKRHIRPKYACPSCKNGVVQAPLPPQPVPGAVAGASLIAFLIVSKYADHLPLCRMERIFARHGVDLPRARMCDWLMAVAALLDTVVKAMAKKIRAGKTIQADETSIRLQSQQKKGKTETAWVWVFVGDHTAPFTIYDFQKSRGRDGPRAMLAGFTGTLQTDAHGAYDAALRENDRAGPGAASADKSVARGGCWAHARRGFIEAEDGGETRASEAIRHIRKLFAFEREWKAGQAGAEQNRNARLAAVRRAAAEEGTEAARAAMDAERQAVEAERQLALDARLPPRQEESKPVVEALYAWMSDRLDVLPQSALGKAIGYMQNQRAPLERFLEDGGLELDNNAAERALRPIAVGRKNWLFAGSERGGKAAATFFSLIESARRNGLNPYDYLADLLSRLPAHPINQIDDLLPDRWLPSKKKS